MKTNVYDAYLTTFIFREFFCGKMGVAATCAPKALRIDNKSQPKFGYESPTRWEPTTYNYYSKKGRSPNTSFCVTLPLHNVKC